jgi:transcriptional regulator GlxA family with amidase domain
MGQIASIQIKKSDRDKRRIERLCHWIQSNLASEMTWDALTLQSGLNHMELQRLFMFHHKTSPMQWIKLQREQLAQQAMKTDARQLMSASLTARSSSLSQH